MGWLDKNKEYVVDNSEIWKERGVDLFRIKEEVYGETATNSQPNKKETNQLEERRLDCSHSSKFSKNSPNQSDELCEKNISDVQIGEDSGMGM